MEDREIIELFRSRSGQAVSAAAEKYGGRLGRLALSFLGSEQDAEECLNDAYLKAWRSIPSREIEDLFGYLARLVRCTAFDMLDKRKAEKRSARLVELTEELAECIPDPAAAFGESELTELLEGFLRSQKRHRQKLFVLRYFYGLRTSEISERTGFSQSKINTALSRMRRELKEHLKRKGMLI
ncbi:MAG: RNA polymerase sigma factor [Ruminococcus sp.]|nr:RNA polymerase sigma factor [Ruminococcus sp.]